MKLKLYTFLSLLSTAELSANTTNARCQIDSLNPDEAKGRNEYVKACYPDVIWNHAAVLSGTGQRPATFKEAWELAEGYLHYLVKTPVNSIDRPRPLHYTPIFVNRPEGDSPMPWSAPRVGPTAEESASDATIKEYCKKPNHVAPVSPSNGAIGFHYLYRCTSSCYAPHVRVFFDNRYLAVKDAFDSKAEKVTVLKDGSTFNNMSYRYADVEHWTVSIRSEPHVLKNITMSSGRVLSVTPNHPLVDGEGYVREADKLQAGDSLVRHDGSREEIIRIDDEDYFGKVYNLKPNGNTAKGNLLIAEGYLSGSDYIQNDGSHIVNERLFRADLPLELVR